MAVERFLPSAIAHFEPADLIGALTTGILVLDSDLCVVYANVAAQDLLAASVNQARGKPFLSLVLDADSLSQLMRRALDTGETLSERELAVQAGPLGRERRALDITMTPLAFTEIEARKIPTTWRIEISSRALAIECTPLNARSWMGTSFPYWEGPISFAGSHTGVGYLEMTGY